MQEETFFKRNFCRTVSLNKAKSDLIVSFEEVGILGIADIWEHWREPMTDRLNDFVFCGY